MGTIEIISFVLGAAWASAIDSSAAILAPGGLVTGQIELPTGLEPVDALHEGQVKSPDRHN